MVQLFSDILSKEEIQNLLVYHYLEDDRTDSRDTVTSKHPRWNIDTWPQHIIERVLNLVLEKTHTVEEVIFNESTISFQIHADSGYNNPNVYKGIIIPLECESGSTVFFDNYWHGDGAKFVRSEDPFGHVVDQEKQLSTKDQRITDYTNIVNYNGRPFDCDFYEKYLTHIPYENLYGLTVETIASWHPGDVIVFDRHQLHCASNEHERKIGISVFTNLSV